ncbi:MAG: transposase [Aeromonas sp.]
MTEELALSFAIRCGILRPLTKLRCLFDNCNGFMNFEKGKIRHSLDGRFRCGSINCRKSISYSFGTLFFRKHISFKNFFDLLYSFCDSKGLETIHEQTDLSKTTICEYFSFFKRLICENGSELNSEKIGGENSVVEIDETLLFKNKNHVGRVLAGQKLWLFGGFDRLTKQVKLNLTLRRRKFDCENFLSSCVHCNSTIYTDCWKGYLKLNELGFIHETVNHSVNFVNPENREIHTNHIERLWRSVKKFVRGSNSLNDLEEKIIIFEVYNNLGLRKTWDKFEFILSLIRAKFPLN